MARASALLFLLFIAACSSSSASSSDLADAAADGSRAGPSPADASSAADSSADASTPEAAAPPSGCDAGTCAQLAGAVKRTATKPTHGGKGPVYVAVFDGNPVTDAANATVVARTLIPDVDLSADGAEVAYAIDGVPVRAQPYQVIAFLDDAHAVSASNPSPAAGDLISLQLSGGISGVPVTLRAPGETMLDLPLNAALP